MRYLLKINTRPIVFIWERLVSSGDRMMLIIFPQMKYLSLLPRLCVGIKQVLILLEKIRMLCIAVIGWILPNRSVCI